MSTKKDKQNDVVMLLSEEDAKKYAGQYVCVENYGSVKVISANKDPLVAHRTAMGKGLKNPVIFYMPHLGEIFIFESETRTTYKRTA